MNSKVILVSARSSVFVSKLKTVLEQSFFNVTDTCLSGGDILRKVNMYNPELVIADYDLGDMTGFQVAEIVSSKKMCSLILLTNDMQKNYVEQYFEYPYVICLRKPVNKEVFLNAIEISLKSQKGIKSLEKEIQRLKYDIETRKTIEKAKGILMKKFDITEDEAYKLIREKSMDSKVSMKNISEKIMRNFYE